ncbi:MAG: CDP-alcohol phosphatidyltransferase family protein, partial [Actinobacteria bacterium]|nr:CDP-alcohol phosphatidyltransferase family protein [Actinomycetota bacterium]
GVPFVLAVGLWALAVLSTVTFGQRVLLVHGETRARGAAPGGRPGPAGGETRAGGKEPDQGRDRA